MSFLAPLFLAAIGAVSLPILLHLIRRTPRGRVLFSSLMFLSPSPPRVTKRSRLEHWLLLALRALAIVLIACAFARPFLWDHAVADSESTGPGRRIAILIDTSASMQREDLWKQAVAAAKKIASEARPTDSVALLAFDRGVNRIVMFDQWSAAPVDLRSALITDALAKAQPGHAATHLGDALIAAADALSETDTAASKAFTGERQIVLISDLQSGSQLQSLGAYDWPAEVRVKLVPIAAAKPTNAGLQVIADRDAASPDAAQSLRLRVSNAADSANERFTIEFNAAVSDAASASKPTQLNIYVPPGESRTIVTGDLSRWLASAGNSISLAGDDHAFDNTAYHCAAQPAEAVVVFLGADDPKDTRGLRYYLDRAFPPSDRLVTRIVALKPDQPLPPGETDGASLFILAGDLPEERTAALRRRMDDGATLLVIVRESNDAAGMSESIARLLSVEPLAIKEASVRDYAMLTDIDFKHPLFAPFADPRFGDFTKIRFWKHRVIDAASIKNARVLARFHGGADAASAPALVEVPAGKGRCLILTAGWQPADGQLALSSKFVPLMNVLLQQSLGRPPAAARYTVGDAIDLAWLSQSPAFAGKTVAVKNPAGQTIALNEQQRVTQTDQPGLYVTEVGDTTLPVAVNVAASESDTFPLPPEELEKRGVKLWQSPIEDPQAAADRQRQMRMTELENRHKLWRWLLVAGLGVLMIETWLAGRWSRGNG